MPAPEIIQVLVKRFADNISYYKSKNYNEAQLRQEFLDPFFEALGWDIYNKKDYAPRYREVIVEKPISFLGSQSSKTPDYTFRLGEDPKFFVEAKRPSENLQASSEFAFQLKAYAWNKHLPLSILTDFEEFLVFDCRRKPTKSDRPDVDCIMKLTYEEYIEKWDELVSIFSPVSIRKGAFDKYAEDNTSKKGVSEVDDEFLKDISTWRELLARNIALRNQSNMDESNLNYAVQMTIDRIIFLRICEDRGIEPFNQLRELADKPEIYQNLKNLFKRAELKYNSGLFTFNNHKKEHNTHQDNLTPTLAIDDKVLKQIITGLYYPASTYNFKAIPVEILGQVYEQFLGKVIRLTPGHQAKIEDKPEVRKAGGVYYTPKYIVDYIVANTVGKLLEGKTPDQVSQLRIVDPACGSGSFLLGAFQYLMDWHEEYYLAHDPQQWVRGKEPALAPLGGDEYRLSTPEKKRILINNIYGVDIDAQAVEVTKLSLLLKVLEEETGQLSLGLEHALPDLGNNIKCGNTIFGQDYFEGQLIPNEEEVKQINPFDWVISFPQVFSQGGFDAVIGNPPYFNIDITWGKNDKKLLAIKRLFPSIYRDKTDILYYFFGKSLTICKGYISFIVSRAFLEAYKADKLRTCILEKAYIQEIIDFQNYVVFYGVGISTCIINIAVNKPKFEFPVYKFISDREKIINLFESINDNNIFRKIIVNRNTINSQSWFFASSTKKKLFDKIDLHTRELGALCAISKGMETGLNKIFEGITNEEIINWGLKKGEYYKRARNSDIYRYKIFNDGNYLLYPQAFKNFSDMPSGLKDYLLKNKKELKQRAAFLRGNCDWWKYTWPLREQYYIHNRIICPFYSKTNRFALDDKSEFISLTDTTVIFDTCPEINFKYLLGLLNSKLLTYRYKNIGKLKGGGIYEYFWNSVSKIPIHIININDQIEVKKHDQIVTLVNHMLELHKRTPQTPHEQEMLQREIASTDAQIDRLVYELYGLTEEEIKIVEENL